MNNVKRGVFFSFNFSGKNQKAQFYLISAIILATIIIGIAAVSNYSKRESNIRLYNLKEELQIESANVLDFGTYNEFNESQIKELLGNFINDYIVYIGEGNIYFIFGNNKDITFIAYQELTEAVSLGLGSEEIILGITQGEVFTEEFSTTGNKVEITIEGSVYEFKLKKGENFYFVISQQDEGGSYIVSG